MDLHLDSPLQTLFSQLLPFAFSFLDDALLLLLPRLGLHVPGLQWLSPVLLTGTVLYWIGRLSYNRYRASLTHCIES